MPIEPDELANIWYASQQPKQELPDPTKVPFKFVKQVGNILPNVFNEIASPIQNLASGYDEKPQPLLPTFDVGPSTGKMDFVMNQLLPGVASYALPYGAISKAGKAAGFGAATTEAIAQGATNAFTTLGATNSPSEAGFEGGVGVASGLAQQLIPNRFQRLGVLLGIGAAQVAHNEDGSMMGAAANTLFNMIPSAHVGIKPPPVELPPVESPSFTNDLRKGVASTDNLLPSVAPTRAPFEPANPIHGISTPQQQQVSGLIQNPVAQGHYTGFDPVIQAHEFVNPDTGQSQFIKPETPEISTEGKSLATPKIEPSFNDVAQKNGARYDTYDPLTKSHQFTLKDEGAQSTFYVKPEQMNPEGIKSAIESKRAEMSTPKIDEARLPEYLDALMKGEGDQWIENFKNEGKQGVPSGMTSEDFELRPELTKPYRSVAMKQGDVIHEGELGDNHASIAERLKFPKDLVPGFVTNEGEFKYQFPEDIPNKLRPLQSEVAGKTNQEMLNNLAVVGTAGLVGAIAYHEFKGDVGSTIAAGIITAGLGFAGIHAFKNFKGRIEVPPDAPNLAGAKVKVSGQTLTQKFDKFAKDTMRTPAGEAVGGRGGLWPNAVHLAESLTGMNGVESLRTAKIHADGFVAAKMEDLTKALNEARPYIKDLSPGFQAAEGQFLRGQLADAKVVQDILDTGKSFKSGEIPKDQLKNYPEKWITLDDPNLSNTKGDGAQVWHVTNATKDALVQAQKDALDLFAKTPADQAYKAFPLKYRDIADSLIQMIHDGLPEGSAERNRLMGTTGQYMTRSHAVITDPKVYPTEQAINLAMNRLGFIQRGEFLSKNAALAPSATHTIPVVHNGNTFHLTPSAANDFQFLHSPESLRGEVRDYIKEIKTNAELKKIGAMPSDSEQFMSSLFTGRKELDAVTQALLETKTVPLEMMNDTLAKLLPAAQASHFLKDAVQMTDKATGLKISLSNIEYNKALQNERFIIENSHSTPQELADARFKYNELRSYSRMPENSKFGLASDSFVSRSLKQQMKGFDGTPFAMLDNPIGKGLRAFNSFFKTTHLALAPASVARQFFQSPIMMMMGNVRDVGMIKTAYEGYFNRTSGYGKWMTEHGIFSSSQAKHDFSHTLDAVLSGDADKTIWQKIKGGARKLQEVFSFPDDIVRASAFMNEAKRVSEKMGIPLSDMHPDVAKAALEFTERRVVNFANLPNYVKIGREIPGVNIFLAYTHEILRVTKNMAIDAAKGDLQAGATLAGIATLPFVGMKMAEESLSSVDRAAWEQAKAVAPDYSRSRFKVPISRNKDGTFTYWDFTSILPHNDYLQMARSVVNKDAEGFAAVNPFVGTEKSPAMNLLVPQITGKDTHTQREFRGAGDRVMNAAQQLLPGWTPGVGREWQKSMSEALGGQLGLENIKTGREDSSIGTLLRNLTGTDITQVNPSLAVANYVKSASHQRSNAYQYMMDTIKMKGISEEGKQRAANQYVEAVKQIVLDLDSKLSLTKANK